MRDADSVEWFKQNGGLPPQMATTSGHPDFARWKRRRDHAVQGFQWQGAVRGAAVDSAWVEGGAAEEEMILPRSTGTKKPPEGGNFARDVSTEACSIQWQLPGLAAVKVLICYSLPGSRSHASGLPA